MKNLLLVLLCSTFTTTYAQTTADIFSASEYSYTVLGIDYSHARFKGEFSQFSEAGSIGLITMKEKYFNGWNELIVREKDKYNIQDALRKENIEYDISDMEAINGATVVEDMENDLVEYTESDIQGFINASEYSVKEGFGIMFFCESLDKTLEEACFHFVIVNMSTKEILIHERMTSAPGGIGMRNYWIKPVYVAISTVEKTLYKRWKKEFTAGK